jgi:hypothetical protein
VTHPSTDNVCDACHSTIAFKPVVVVDHAHVLGSCSGCHDGIKATGKGTKHFVTTRECDYCHTTNLWAPSTFVHSSPNYPGNHRANLACTACHKTNAEVVAWPFPAYQGDCAGCHSNSYRAGSHKKTESPTTINYTVDELRDCAGACHEYTNNTFTTIKTARNAHHRVSDGGW